MRSTVHRPKSGELQIQLEAAQAGNRLRDDMIADLRQQRDREAAERRQAQAQLAEVQAKLVAVLTDQRHRPGTGTARTVTPPMVGMGPARMTTAASDPAAAHLFEIARAELAEALAPLVSRTIRNGQAEAQAALEQIEEVHATLADVAGIDDLLDNIDAAEWCSAIFADMIGGTPIASALKIGQSRPVRRYADHRPGASAPRRLVDNVVLARAIVDAVAARKRHTPKR